MFTGKYYHVYNRGINRQLIFFEEKNSLYFLKQFKKYVSPYVDVFAYCLMPNHFHFFIRVKENDSEITYSGKLSVIEKAFKDFFISYVKSINKQYNRTGALLQYKFKRQEVEDESHYTWLIYYIRLNPISAGLCKNFSDWKFSSYTSLISNKNTELKRDEILEWFGGVKQFISFHELNLKSRKQNIEFESKFRIERVK
jgi:REP element-mobilizing transposase RayT